MRPTRPGRPAAQRKSPLFAEPYEKPPFRKRGGWGDFYTYTYIYAYTYTPPRNANNLMLCRAAAAGGGVVGDAARCEQRRRG